MAAKLLLAAILFFSSLSPTSAVDLTVSSTGSSNGNCAASTPCTFAWAQSLALSGDVITILGTITPITITKPGLTIRGGTVDGIGSSLANSAAVMISADNTILEDLEIKNGWAYGFRTSANIKNTTVRRINLHHNVRENFASNGGCITTNTHGWGSAMRAYFADGLNFTDSHIWENCGEGFSAVMSNNIHGLNLTLWDNWSVGAYPDQTTNYSLHNSAIFCLKPEFNRLGHNRAILLGGEDSYGDTSVITRDITIQNNHIYHCKGLAAYSQTPGSFTNINFTHNFLYNIYGTPIEAINGSSIVTSPNTITTTTDTPLPTPPSNPSPPPPPLSKPGDLNSDNTVNLLDFNLLISKFGNPYTLLDFNLIIANFGNTR